MNRQVNLPAMQRIMMQFEKEGDMMEMKQELMDDTIDDVMQQEGDQEQEDELVNQVFSKKGNSAKMLVF
jgi:charged multivesicular body protein 2A